jgi:hypothetical protein
MVVVVGLVAFDARRSGACDGAVADTEVDLDAPGTFTTHPERWRGYICVALSAAGLAVMGLRGECLVQIEGEAREAGEHMQWWAEMHFCYGEDTVSGLGCKAS